MPAYYLRAPRPIPELLGVAHEALAPLLDADAFMRVNGYLGATLRNAALQQGSNARGLAALAQEAATPVVAFSMLPGWGGWRRNHGAGKTRYREFLLPLGYTEAELDAAIASWRGTPRNQQDTEYPNYLVTDFGVSLVDYWHLNNWESKPGLVVLPGIFHIDNL